MRKEWTIISILFLGLVADILWMKNTNELNLNVLLQIVLAVLLISFIYLIGRKYLLTHSGWQPKFSLASILRLDR
jgi:hypothetical protein